MLLFCITMKKVYYVNNYIEYLGFKVYINITINQTYLINV